MHLATDDVLATLADHLLVDGFDFVLDLDASHGRTLVDQRDGAAYLDLFSFFASNALGMNHPALHTEAAERALLRAARHKPSNSDVYTDVLAAFAETFARVMGDERLPHLFFVEGGALGIENCLKAAFDWKSRRNEAAGRDPSLGSRVLHLRHAFHGRTGYTLSLTNTDPVKTDRFPQFDWPRIPSPALRFPLDEHAAENDAADGEALAAARDAFERHPDDIACFIAEPIQAEGGDRHLSASFLHAMQDLCIEHDALFVLDEVQTGVGLTGSRWCYEAMGLEPDLVAFGKKTHIAGMMGGGRLDEVEDNVFSVSSRINSTFGGGLADMARATIMLEVIERDGLVERAAGLGEKLQALLSDLEARHDIVSNARGRGMLCAVDLPDGATRDEAVRRLFRDERVMLIGCGDLTLRFRPPLTIEAGELEAGVEALDRVIGRL